ncbi:hypothetical protein D3C80_1357600 [compost metagenome]
MRGLQHLVIGGQDQRLTLRPLHGQEVGGLALHVLEAALQRGDVIAVEVGFRLLTLVLEEDLAVGQAFLVELQVIDVVDALNIHGQTLQPVGQLARDHVDLDAADALEIGELRHLHAVAPDLPAQAPGADGGVFPVVLDEADVVQLGVDADGGQRAEIQLLQVVRVRLQDDLILVIVLQPVGVLAIAAVAGTA